MSAWPSTKGCMPEWCSSTSRNISISVSTSPRLPSPRALERSADGLAMSGAPGPGERDIAQTSRPLRVAVASIGDPESPDTWSGVTAGVFRALHDLGVETRGLDLALPTGLEQTMLMGAAISTRNRFDAHGAALTMKIRSLLVRARTSGENLDGV